MIGTANLAQEFLKDIVVFVGATGRSDAADRTREEIVSRISEIRRIAIFAITRT